MEKKDILDFLFYFFGFHIIRKRYLKIRRIPIARFLVFHNIPLKYSVQFENNIRLLKKYTNVISLDDFMNGNLSNDNINTVITFDDGYKSWKTIALPVLKKYGLTATFFISSGFIIFDNNKNIQVSEKAPMKKGKLLTRSEPLTVNDIIEINKSGNIIGSHTVNHVILKQNNGISKLEKEVLEDKKRLEEITGKQVKYFAYPFGSVGNCDTNLARILKSFGFEAAVTLDPGFNTKSTNRYFLYRDIVRGGTNSFVFLSRSLGNQDFNISNKIQMLLKDF